MQINKSIKFVPIQREAELQFVSGMQRKFMLLRFFFGVADHCQNNLTPSHYLLPGIAPVLKNSADSFALLAKATQ